MSTETPFTENTLYRPLGGTGLHVSLFGFGAWGIGGNTGGNSYGETDDNTSVAALHTAYEAGCTLFDTSHHFGDGHSESLLGQALAQWDRSRVVISTKASERFAESQLRENLINSLKRLNTDYIDVYHLETPSMALIQLGKVFDVLARFQAEGLIRFGGITIHDPQEGIQASKHPVIGVIEAPYHLFDRRIETTLLPHLKQTETAPGLFIREPLANGFLTGKFLPDVCFTEGDWRTRWPKLYIQKRVSAVQTVSDYARQIGSNVHHLALQFAQQAPGVSSVLVGCKTPEQVRQNIHALHTSLPVQDGDIDASFVGLEAVLGQIF
ncbi:MAG: aldo/keto reductase [Cyanobacteria bacterium]|nr:aldo/keto reductase [Cyanobacteriota bacterium]